MISTVQPKYSGKNFRVLVRLKTSNLVTFEKFLWDRFGWTVDPFYKNWRSIFFKKRPTVQAKYSGKNFRFSLGFRFREISLVPFWFASAQSTLFIQIRPLRSLKQSRLSNQNTLGRILDFHLVFDFNFSHF